MLGRPVLLLVSVLCVCANGFIVKFGDVDTEKWSDYVSSLTQFFSITFWRNNNKLFICDKVSNVLKRGVIKFTLDLDKAIDRSQAISNDNMSNIILSPLNLINTLAIIHLGAHGITFDEIMDAFDLRNKLFISYHSEMVHQVFARLITNVCVHQENSSMPLITTSTAVFSEVRYCLKLESSLRRIWIIVIIIVRKFELYNYLLAYPKVQIRPYTEIEIIKEVAASIYKYFHVHFFFFTILCYHIVYQGRIKLILYIEICCLRLWYIFT